MSTYTATAMEEFMRSPNQLYELSEKYTFLNGNTSSFSAVEKETVETVNAWAKHIGETGFDEKRELAAYVTRVIEDVTYNRPDEILSRMFNDDSIGEFDDYETEVAPKNTLVAYEAAKGGTVDKSYIDETLLKPIWKHNQVETEISYEALRKNGFKTVAKMTVYAKEALANKKLRTIFSILDQAITGGEQVFEVTGGTSALTKEILDKLCLYVLDWADDTDAPFMFGLNKYAQQIANMTGYNQYMSGNMKEQYNRYGLVKDYGGLAVFGFSGQRKIGDGELAVPDKRIFGVAGKIGNLTERGNLRVYETPDNKREVIELKFTGYEYGMTIAYPEKVAMIKFQN